MQLCLENSELNLIANILLERESRMSIPSTPDRRNLEPPNASASLKVDREMCEGILQRVLARDTALDCDELEQLAIVLKEEQTELRMKTGAAPATDTAALAKKRQQLERVLEKIEEACVMI